MKKINLRSPVKLLKGVGEKKFSALESLGITTLGELLYYFPRKYLDRNFTKDVFLKTGEVVTVLAQVVDSYLAHGKKSRLVITVRTQKGEKISLIFFKGLAYFRTLFHSGTEIVLTGKLEYFQGLQIIHPQVEILSEKGEENLLHAGRIIPLYSSSEALAKVGLDSRGFRRLIGGVLDLVRDGSLEIPEVLPEDILQKRNLVERKTALREIHFPDSQQSLEDAKKRLIYEELYFFSLLLEYKKLKREKFKRILWPLPESLSSQKVIERLPFSLTEAQIKALETLKELSKSESPMAVLLQGDVGSGKTITALLNALRYIDNQIQVCLLAPTEILAKQHYTTIYNFLGNQPFLGLDLLIGKEKEKMKREKLDRLAKGDTMFVVGTHSLLQEEVVFSDLGLVIIDEQHKFGVEQREAIRAKGKNPDILAMTATPIPRTLCLTLYGDLNLITIPTKPANRKPIKTIWLTEEKRSAMYHSMKKYISQGRQAYVVYPLIEESEKLDIQSCIEGYENLKQVFKEFEVGLLHGKMKPEEKDYIMNGFKKNQIQILVTTTVVEVGVDVPNATILVVESADRFGLSQLHQLRGRVGRGDLESHCILMTKGIVSEEAEVRLKAMVEYNDGFKLSEIDLQLRGPGELLGVRQSGLPDFKIADLRTDQSLIELAREDAKGRNLGELEQTEIRERFEEGKILFPN